MRLRFVIRVLGGIVLYWHRSIVPTAPYACALQFREINYGAAFS